ncbi:MAG: endo-1,4-beta-xylanase [Opitutales bacterium]
MSLRCFPLLLAAVVGGVLAITGLYLFDEYIDIEKKEVPLPTQLFVPEPRPLPGQALVFSEPAPADREGWLEIAPAQARQHLNRGESIPNGVLRYVDYGGIAEWVTFAEDGTQRISVEAGGIPSKGGYPRLQVEVRDLDNEVLFERKFTVFASDPALHDLEFEAPAGPAVVHVYYMRGVFPEGKGDRLDISRVAVENARLLDAVPPQPTLRDITDPLIQQHRTGIVRVLAKPGASVSVQQTRHHFRFGVNIPSTILRKDFSGKDFTKEDADQLLALTKEYFNSVTPATLYWSSIQKDFDDFGIERTDRAIEWANENNMHVQAHTVFWGSDVHGRIRPWQKEMGDNDLRTVIRQHGYRIAERYKGRIDEYDFLNEIVHHKYYRFRMGDIVYDMVSSMLAADPNAGLALNEFNIITHAAIDEYIEIAEELLDMGVPLTSIGLQYRTNGEVRLEHAWDAFDRISELGLPIHLSELDYVVADEVQRAVALERGMRVGFAHPAVHAMTLWGLWDTVKWNQDAALWDADWNRLPAGDALHRLLREEWWTQFSGDTNAAGELEVRAFHGNHTVTVDGQEFFITLTPEDETVIVDAR